MTKVHNERHDSLDKRKKKSNYKNNLKSHKKLQGQQKNEPYRVIESPLLYPEIVESRSGVKVLDTYKNLEFLLKHFNAEIKYNLMSRRREINLPGLNFFSDDRANDTLAKIEYLATINHMPWRNIDKWLEVLAGENAYHPIVDCLEGNKWDGIGRLDSFLETIKTNNPNEDKEIIKTFMLMAVSAAYSQGDFISHGILVIQGEQGIGKTAWVRKLDPIHCNAIKVGALLDPKNKDTIINVNRFWIAELGELDATLNKTDIAHLKSFITSPVDDIRVPYGRKDIRLIRRTAFIATVNETEFLVDTTGNRRFLTIAAESINYNHDFNMVQVWAEVHHELKNGAKPYIQSELQSFINIRNKSHEKTDSLKEKLLSIYDWSGPFTTRGMTVTDVLKVLGYERPTPTETRRMGRILKEQTGSKGRKSNGLRVYDVPTRFNQSFVK